MAFRELHAKPLNTATGQVLAPYLPGGGHGRRRMENGKVCAVVRAVRADVLAGCRSQQPKTDGPTPTTGALRTEDRLSSKLP